jgi:hypothetical protein
LGPNLHQRRRPTSRPTPRTQSWITEKRKHEFKEGADDKEKGELKALVAARDKLRQSSKPLPDGEMWKSLVAPPKDYLGYKVVPWTEKGE